MTERLHSHFSLSCIGEGNGNPLQCSCLENLRDGGAWWAAVYGVAQSWTRLKRLSSSSSSSIPPQLSRGWQGSHSLGGGGVIAKLHPTLATPWTVSLQAPLCHGIFQARILEWDAISFSSGSSPQGSNLHFLHCQRILYHWVTRDALVCWPNSLWDLEHIT